MHTLTKVSFTAVMPPRYNFAQDNAPRCLRCITSIGVSLYMPLGQESALVPLLYIVIPDAVILMLFLFILAPTSSPSTVSPKLTNVSNHFGRSALNIEFSKGYSRLIIVNYQSLTYGLHQNLIYFGICPIWLASLFRPLHLHSILFCH